LIINPLLYFGLLKPTKMKRAAIFSLSIFMILIQSVQGLTNSGILPGEFENSVPLLLAGNSAGVFVECTEAVPLQTIYLAGAEGNSVSVFDGIGREYFQAENAPLIKFRAGGALGRHTVKIYDSRNRILDELSFHVDARTKVDDHGYYSGMFNMFEKGMRIFGNNGVGSTKFQGNTYHHFVHWLLDHFHTMKGMQYFEGTGHEIVDLFRQAQRENGMVMSNVRRLKNPSFWETAYGPEFTHRYEGDLVFIRQPVENHCEYIYVLILYHGWKATGDDQYLERNIVSADRALDYSVTDPLRWSTKYNLLKRAFTIDSWDFQVKDEYTPDLGTGTDMKIHPEKTKFGIFYGDNTGYALACDRMVELYQHMGNQQLSEKYRKRASEIRKNLNDLSWNGRFFTHFIDEDENIVRKLGVDIYTQISHSNMYSLNRNLEPEQNQAIIKTYQDLRENLPPGSPGEWYAIYPPFQKGFGDHNEIWQYMNGGIAGHAAGELARGAFENGFESYGTDILERLYELGKENRYMVAFAYTGAYPDPPSPVFKTLDLSGVANMDISAPGGPEAIAWMVEHEGNDMRNIPVGRQVFAGINFSIPDPNNNGGRAVVAVSATEVFPDYVTIPVDTFAGSVYLLHASNRVGKENVCGSIRFNYSDGKSVTQYIIRDKHLASWWFPELRSNRGGIAWRGENQESFDVGVSWTAIDNPQPEKQISSISLQSAKDKSIYAVLAMTLSDQPHYVRPPLVSYGGPNNWAAGTAMAGLVEGLCGVSDRSTRFDKPVIAPRWTSSKSDSISVTIRYAASDGYVAYLYHHDPENNTISLVLTGSGKDSKMHVLLPEGVPRATEVSVGGKPVAFEMIRLGSSVYTDFSLASLHPQDVLIKY
jgi:hypothetical protein